MDIGKGTRVASFELLALIGQGGMGRVYRARDLKLRRDVAVKLLHEKYRQNRDLLRRFEQEAQAASALSHPNIVTIHEIGEIEDGPFIVMELVDGPRLRDLLTERPLTMKEAVRIASGVADGLAAAHSQGIAHRDLKPENIIIASADRPKILDFGLAKLIDAWGGDDDATPAIGETNPGLVLGTPAYMSPEQASGRAADHRSDQFSFGAIVYEMLTGRPVFRRNTSVETMAAIIRDEPEPIEDYNPHVPPALKRLVMRCLNKSPTERYDSTADLAHDLRGIVLDITTSKATPVSQARPHRRIPRAAAWAVAALLVVALAGTAIFYRSKANAHATVLQPRRVQLAILPFNDVTGDPSTQRIGEGLADMIAARIGGVSELQVITPAAAKMWTVGNDMRAVARELGVNAVLRGSVLRSGDRLRISYSVIDPASGVQLTSQSVDGATNDLFAVEDQLSSALLQALAPGAAPATRSGDYLLTSSAQDRYFEAVGALQRYEDEASVDSAISLLEELQKSAGSSALAKAALGRAYLYKFNLTHDKEWADKAEAVCREAAEIDPAQPETRITMGELFTRSGRYPEAIDSFRRVLQARPRSPEATLGLAEALGKSGDQKSAEKLYREAIAMRPIYWAGYNKLGAFLMGMGRFEEAAPMFAKVVELTPDNVRGYNNLAASQMKLGRLKEAVAPLEKSISIKPNGIAWSNLGTCYYYLGRFSDAVRACREATVLTPGEYSLWYNYADACRWDARSANSASAAYAKAIALGLEETNLNPSDSLAFAVTAAAYAKIGNVEKARELIGRALKLTPEDPDALVYDAIISTIARQPDAAFASLQRAVRGGYQLTLIENDPEFASLRKDPRFSSLKN